MQRNKIAFGMVIISSLVLAGCATNLSPHSCEVMPQPDQDGNVQVDARSNHDKNHRCSELDAAAYLLASLVREGSKGDECKNKSGKS
ncbi:MAG: hypothetical protein HAW66_08790, partial [Shewanella sp.]|nr:hypothetical protein [Shewanella sp.]